MHLLSSIVLAALSASLAAAAPTSSRNACSTDICVTRLQATQQKKAAQLAKVEVDFLVLGKKVKCSVKADPVTWNTVLACSPGVSVKDVPVSEAAAASPDPYIGLEFSYHSTTGSPITTKGEFPLVQTGSNPPVFNLKNSPVSVA